MLAKKDIQSSGHVELHSNGWWRSRVTDEQGQDLS